MCIYTQEVEENTREKTNLLLLLLLFSYYKTVISTRDFSLVSNACKLNHKHLLDTAWSIADWSEAFFCSIIILKDDSNRSIIKAKMLKQQTQSFFLFFWSFFLYSSSGKYQEQRKKKRKRNVSILHTSSINHLLINEMLTCQ